MRVKPIKPRSANKRDESDRLARVARLFAFAEDVLGSRDEAQRWMKTPNRSLDGARPLDELDTEVAAREVEDLLGRIRYGVFGYVRLFRITQQRERSETSTSC